jgi:hypothetical protein
MIGIYVVMYVGRLISFFIFKKQIFTYGYGCTMKEFAVFIHGGLRGAVGLSFAMLANADEQLSPALRDIVIIWMINNVSSCSICQDALCSP